MFSLQDSYLLYLQSKEKSEILLACSYLFILFDSKKASNFSLWSKILQRRAVALIII